EVPRRECLDGAETQVREDAEDPTGAAHTRGALLTDAPGELPDVLLDTQAFRLAEPRLPLHPDPTAVAAEDQHAVAVLKGDRAAALVRGRIARRLEVFDERDVRGREVVAVHRVLDRELPVAADRIEVRAWDDLEPPLRMVGHEIEVLARVTEMLAQARPVEGERHEDEAAVVLDTRQPTQAHGRGAPTLRRIGPRIRDARGR